MQTKLTLRLDSELIERAKAHARRRRKSVSQMVAGYFSFLDQEEEVEAMEPVTRALRGALRGAQVDEAQHRQHLEEKHL
ncbi:MAG: antitoxin [Gemmatimonadetes bacterium]|jgi:hypothetical protein|nr:antitoxin [Gemmatimonadota bacterium]